MALLHLELDIDADVYPELHATLTSLVSDASRGERLRQLAAAGLVWEKLRIRGQAALHGVAPDLAAPLAAAAPAPARAPRSAGSGRAPAAARSAAPPPVALAVPAAPPRPAPAGFVDLALDAAPEPPPPPPLPPAVSSPLSPPMSPPPAPMRAAHWPPVLMDVVEPEAFTTATPVPRTDDRPSRPMPLAPPDAASHPARLQQQTPPVPARPVDELHDLAPPDPGPPIEHRSSTRSRLLRMKEKGLFKNG